VWPALQAQAHEIQNIHMREFFAHDPKRAQTFSMQACGIFLDYSKNRIDTSTLQLLLQLVREANVLQWAERMFNGDKINNTEQRAVLHTALRSKSSVYVDGEDVLPKIKNVLERMRHCVERVRQGTWRGCTGKPITDVVNIGIGGSDLGPAMVTQALKPYGKRDLRMHFVSNVDGRALIDVLDGLHHDTTLFIIASKTFATQETITNAYSAQDWFLKRGAQQTDISKHFIAVSTHHEAVVRFGIDPQNIFEFWDWVGGRYSLWSAIGLPIALSIGMENFEALLQGAAAMDDHFRTSPFEQNMPVIMAVLGIWYNNLLGAHSQAIIPYAQDLARFPAFLQQTEMESNGKRISRNGAILPYRTAPVIWGEVGTNSQHAFFQMLHQGTQLIPIDFLAPLESQETLGDHHKILLANFFAQSEALMRGKTPEEVAIDCPPELIPHKVFPGNQPSNTLVFNKLSPKMLGSLIALYEHKVFVQSILWDVNAFDQTHLHPKECFVQKPCVRTMR